jgi:hypothetical protein
MAHVSQVRTWIAWLAVGVGFVVVAFRLGALDFAGNGDYLREQLLGAASDGLIILLLPIVLLRPASRPRVDLLLAAGTACLAVGVVYRFGLERVDILINQNLPPLALPQGPNVEPIVITGCGALGAWLLAAALFPLASGRRPSVWHVALLGYGLLSAGLVLVSATLDGWAPDDQIAVRLTAVGALGWAAVAAMALQEAPSMGGRGLILLASLLTLSAVALNAASLLAAHRMTDLISSYDAFLYVRVLEFGSSLSLAAGLFLLTSRANVLGLLSSPKLKEGRQQPVS